MDQIGLLEEAGNCRRRALAYLGQPEAVLLLRIAKAFEELDGEKRGLRSRRARAGTRDPRPDELITIERTRDLWINRSVSV